MNNENILDFIFTLLFYLYQVLFLLWYHFIFSCQFINH